MAEIEITEANFEQEVIKSEIPVLVDFWAPWCGPCKMLEPTTKELSEEYAGKIKICKLNTDDSPEIASRYQITAIPTIMFFKAGKQVNELVGLHPKNEIKKILDDLI